MNKADSIILLIEDDDNDQVFIKRAFKRSGVANIIMTVNNGEEAIEYLRGTGQFADRSAHPLPSLIITDLKMPRMGGIDFLAWLDEEEELRSIPVVVLTSSSDQADISAAFKHGAKGYMIKPVQFGDLEKLAKTIADYWRSSCVPDPRNT